MGEASECCPFSTDTSAEVKLTLAEVDNSHEFTQTQVPHQLEFS